MTDKAVPNTLEQKLDAGHKVADGAKAETVATDPKNSAKARRMEMLAVLGAHSPTLDQLKKDQQLNPSAIARPFTLVSESGHEISSTPKPDGARAQERGSGYQEILARNPVLFSLTQKIDQDDINKTYPPRGHTPSVVRRSDGTLERAKESQ
jgi:hypothetical protein